MKNKKDNLTLNDQVIYGALSSLAKEVGQKLKRSAFSSIIRESDDYGAAVVSANYELVSEAETTPLQMGPLASYCKGFIENLYKNGDKLNRGGIYLHNDPYSGASHSPDIGVIAPLYVKNKLFGFIATAAHHVDIGSAVPGTCIINAHDSFSEGLRLISIPVELDYIPQKYIWKLIENNVRMPKMVIGDLQAQVSACRFGQAQFKLLLQRYNIEEVERSVSRLLNIAERKMEKAILDLPDGIYFSEGYLDGYEDTGETDIRIAVKITIKACKMHVDLDGSAPQLPHAPINMPFFGTTDMAILLTLRTLLLPQTEFPDLPHNTGLFRPITISAPLGTIVNPIFPAPTIGRFCGGQMLSNLVIKALAKILPDIASAGCSTTKAITFSGIRDQKSWVYMDITEGAYGATKGSDGLDAVDTLYANTKNNPIEDIEAHYPLRVERYELRENLAGDGQWRGGFGPIRDTRILEKGFVSVEGDGFRHPPWGLEGGKDGAIGGVVLIKNNGESRTLPSKINNLSLEAGTIVRDLCPSGGGYGSPEKRSKELKDKDKEEQLM